MSMKHDSVEAKAIANALADMRSTELLELLYRVFDRRREVDPRGHPTEFWRIVRVWPYFHSSDDPIFQEPDWNPEDALTSAMLALPKSDVERSDNQDFLQGGDCNRCGTQFSCTEKIAECPACKNMVYCT
jgi:hypothetical protein